MPGQAHCPRRHPPHPAAAVIPVPHCVSLHHRQCTTCGQGGLLTAGAGAHPACCTGIGLVLRPQPDPDVPQARCSIGDCPATPASRLALTMTPLILCLHFIPSAPRCFRFAQGYRCCEPWAPPASVAILRSLACNSPPIAIARAQNRRKIEISPQFCLKIFDKCRT